MYGVAFLHIGRCSNGRDGEVLKMIATRDALVQVVWWFEGQAAQRPSSLSHCTAYLRPGTSPQLPTNMHASQSRDAG